MGVAYANLRLSRGVLPTYLICLSFRYVDVVFNSIRHLHILVGVAMVLQEPVRLLQHLYYFIRCPHMSNKCCNLFYCSIYFISLHMNPQLYAEVQLDPALFGLTHGPR